MVEPSEDKIVEIVQENQQYKFPDGCIIDIPFPNGLSSQQKKLLEELYHWWDTRKNIKGEDNIFLVKGFAGVGKTSVIKFFLQYLVDSKKIGKGFAISAPSHQARKQLFKSIRTMQVRNKFNQKPVDYISGPNAREFFKARTFTTQAAFQTQLVLNTHGGMEYTKDIEVTAGYSKLVKSGVPVVSLWVIDEVSMISDPVEIEKVKYYSRMIPVIVMGDPAQLRNPGTQKLSPLFSSRNVTHSVALREVMRTGKDNPLIGELTELRNNIRSIRSPLSYLTRVGPDGEGIIYSNTIGDIITKLYTDPRYQENRAFVKIVAKSNEKVSQYNKMVRGILGLDVGEYSYSVGDTLMGYSQSVEIFYNSQEYIVNSIKIEPIGLLEMVNTTIKNGQKAGLDDFTLGTLNSGKQQIVRMLSELGKKDLSLIPYTLEITESDSIFDPVKMMMFIFDMKDPDHVKEFDRTGELFNLLYDRVEALKREQKKIEYKERKEFWREKILPIESALKLLSATLQTNENIYRYNNKLISESEIERNVKMRLADRMLSYEQILELVEITKKKASMFKEKSIDYGYAITAYKSQGATYENTIVDLDNIEGRNHYWRNKLKENPDKIENLNSEIYVAMSRSSRCTYALSQSTRQEGSKDSDKIYSPYPGVENIADTGLSLDEANNFIDLLQPQILNQSYVENRAHTANRMFSFGLRWAKNIPNETEKSYQRKLGLQQRPGRVSIKAPAKYDGYGYYLTDQNNKPLPGIKELQPIMDFIQSKLGIDLKDYDSVLANIYESGSFIHQHRDITESITAKNYPVVVINLGADGSLMYHTDFSDETKHDLNINTYTIFEKNPEKINSLVIKNGGIYAFGINGVNRFTFNHRVSENTQNTKTKPIIVPVWDEDGNKVGETTLTNYRITLTFRRAQDILKEPQSPARLFNTTKDGK